MSSEDRLIQILEKQKKDLVLRVLKKHEEVLANKSFIEKMMSSLPDLIVVFSVDFRIVKANREFYNVLGFDKEKDELSLADITSENNRLLLESRFVEGDFRDIEISLIGRNGITVPVIVRGTSDVSESGLALHMLMANDRRDFYEIMSRMREVQDQLIHSGRLASLGEMAAGIGHELTQPLNTVLLLARNCQKAMVDPVAHEKLIRENLSTIVDRINHASSIIRSLRGFASKAKEQLIPCRVNVILIDVLNFLEAQLLMSEIRVELNMGESDFWVLGQEVRLEQVLLNLVQNAIQAMAETPEPILTVEVRRETGIEPQSLQSKSYVVVSISDNGTGIAPEIQDKVFDPFFTTREVGAGMGLGLSIVERIVRGFGGHIKMNSMVGEGTTFNVFLPEGVENQFQTTGGDNDTKGQ